MNSSEEYRHQCEVRWCIRQGFQWFQGYIRGVNQERGKEAARRLWADVKQQAALGNKGEPGRWITQEMPTGSEGA